MAVVPEEYLPHLIDAIIDSVEGLNENNQDRQNELKTSLNEVQKKIDTIEEKFFVTGEMSKDAYEKFLSKFSKEKEEPYLLSPPALQAVRTLKTAWNR